MTKATSKSPQSGTRRRSKRGRASDETSNVLPADVAAQIPAGPRDKVKMRLAAEWTSDGAPKPAAGEVLAEEEEYEPIDPDSVLDPLTDFLTAWGSYAELGYQLGLIRRPDSHMAGQFYVSCDEIINYQQIPFRPTTLIQDIQKYFGHSGGRARISLKDHQARFITGAHCNFTVPNPPERKQPEQPPQTSQQTQAPASAPVDPLTDALRAALISKIRRDAEGLLNPGAGNTSQPAGSLPAGVDAEKFAVAKFLMADPSVREGVVRNIIGAATGKAGDPELTGWQWIAYQTFNNPDALRIIGPLLGQVLSIFPSLLGRRLPGAPPQGFQTITPEVEVQPPPRPRQPAGIPHSTAFAPADANDYRVDEGAEDETETMRDVYYLALDAVIEALRADSPISNDAAWVVAMKEAYPEQIKQALGMVKIFDVDTIQNFLITQDASYKGAFKLPHARKWLAQFKAAVDNGQLTV